jgi:hypothetical protein
LRLETFVLFCTSGCLALKWGHDRARDAARAAFYQSARAELALFEHIVTHGTETAQMWTAAFYWEHLRGIRVVSSRVKGPLGGWVPWLAAGALCLVAFLLSAAGSLGWAGGNTVGALDGSAALLATASLLLTVFLRFGKIDRSLLIRSRTLQLEFDHLRDTFSESDLGPRNVRAFVTAVIRAEMAYEAPDSAPPPRETRARSDNAAGFTLLEFIEVDGGDRTRRISLYHGDLSRMPEPVDFLVVSAFPDDYTPISGTVIASLDASGISVAALAGNKEHDLRRSCGFWVSQDLSKLHPEAGFRRLLCFESAALGSAPQTVGELFRGMFPFLDMTCGSTVATSLLAAGSQNYAEREMFRSLIESAIEWLRRGLPINELKIGVRSAALARVLAGELQDLVHTIPRKPPESSTEKYDVFLSYSSRDAAAAAVIKDAIASPTTNIRVFDFKNAIDFGKSYQYEIDRSIESCRKIVAVMSPSYFCSPECQEELHMARLRNKRADHSVLLPIYWQSPDSELKLWIQAVNYADCRECDERKLLDAVRGLM